MSSYLYSFYSPADFTADTFFNNGFIGLNGFLLLGNFNNGFNGLTGFIAAIFFNNGFNGYYFQGVHLSPLGFAACQSKKCTNQEVHQPSKKTD